MDRTLAELLAQAKEQEKENNLEGMLRCYLKIINRRPHMFSCRTQIAIWLSRLGYHEQAAAVFGAVATYYTEAGFPLSAIEAVCELRKISESDARRLARRIASTYRRGAKRIGNYTIAEYPVFTRDYSAEIEPEDRTLDQLIELSARIASDTSGISDYPKHLPVIPCLSGLDADVLAEVIGLLEVRRFEDGEVICEEGQPADSFYMLVQGRVKAYRKSHRDESDAIRLKREAIFGSVSLLAGSPRIATYEAVGDTAVLEVSRRVLDVVAQSRPELLDVLVGQGYRWLLRFILVSCPVFIPLAGKDRTRFLRMFKSYWIERGKDIIRENAEGRGMYVILTGRVVVWKQIDGKKVLLSVLEAGDVVGEISLFKQVATTATVTAVSDTDFIYLDRDTFDRALRRFPILEPVIAGMAERRMRHIREVMQEGATADTTWDQEALAQVGARWAQKSFRIEDEVLDDILGTAEPEVLEDV